MAMEASLRRPVKIAAIIVLCIVTLAAAACSNGSKEPEKVRIGEVTRSIFYAPEYVAISQGFFTEEGLEVELTTTFGGDKTMTALLTDAIDIALVGSETSIYVYNQGAEDPVINFAQLTQTDGTFLVGRNPDDNFSWDKLKGSTFLGQRKYILVIPNYDTLCYYYKQIMDKVIVNESSDICTCKYR